LLQINTKELENPGGLLMVLIQEFVESSEEIRLSLASGIRPIKKVDMSYPAVTKNSCSQM